MTLRRRGYLAEARRVPADVMKPASYPYGEPGDSFRKMAPKGKSTLVWGGAMKDSFLPLSDFDDVRAGNVLRHDLGSLKKRISKSGLKGGPGQRILVYVDAKGNAKVAEGNHRVAALRELRKEKKVRSSFKVPTTVTYYGNSDLKAGSWVPRSKR